MLTLTFRATLAAASHWRARAAGISGCLPPVEDGAGDSEAPRGGSIRRFGAPVRATAVSSAVKRRDGHSTPPLAQPPIVASDVALLPPHGLRPAVERWP